METGEIIGYVLTALGGGGVTQFFNWRINKRRGNAEVKRDEIENIHRTVEDVYKPLVEQQNIRIKELETEVRELRNQLAKERQEHQDAMAAMQKQIVEINRALGINAKKAIRDKKTGQFISPKEVKK
jgi:Mg2+ and Co2+ transporter CorA